MHKNLFHFLYLGAVHTMSGLDASFLYFETPTMHMHVIGTFVLDPSSSPDPWSSMRVVELLRARLHLLPAFRRRLQPSALWLHHPGWVDVAHVEVTDHLSTATCPTPGGERELAGLVAEFAGRQLDRSRPLWEVLVVDGLAAGRSAVVIKVHHSAVDGVGAGDILSVLLDLDPAGRTAAQLADVAQSAQASEIPLLSRVAHAATGVLTRPIGVVQLLPTVARSLGRLARVRTGAGSGGGGALPFVAPRAPFNGRIGPDRVVAFADVAIEDLKVVKAGLGGTFHDVVVALSGGAFRSYLQSRGDLPASSLIAVCPVSVRTDLAGGNAVSAMFTTLATDIADPTARYAAVRRANDVAKGDHEAIGGDLLHQVAQLLPPNTATWLARAYSAGRLADLHPVVHNVVISSVPGPPLQLFLAGAAVDALYPLGPVLEGPALNVTVASYRDRVGFGFIGCAQRIPDVADLAAAVPGALAELVQAAQGAP